MSLRQDLIEAAAEALYELDGAPELPLNDRSHITAAGTALDAMLDTLEARFNETIWTEDGKWPVAALERFRTDALVAILRSDD